MRWCLSTFVVESHHRLMLSHSLAGIKIPLHDNILVGFFVFFLSCSILAAVLRFSGGGGEPPPPFYLRITAGPLWLISQMQTYIPSDIFQSECDREPCGSRLSLACC